MSELKKCNKCHVLKELHEFYPDQRYEHRKRNTCIKCVLEHQKTKREEKKNNGEIILNWEEKKRNRDHYNNYFTGSII
jgi:hypothetical protein